MKRKKKPMQTVWACRTKLYTQIVCFVHSVSPLGVRLTLAPVE